MGIADIWFLDFLDVRKKHHISPLSTLLVSNIGHSKIDSSDSSGVATTDEFKNPRYHRSEC